MSEPRIPGTAGPARRPHRHHLARPVIAPLPVRPPRPLSELRAFVPRPLSPPGPGQVVTVNQGASGIGDGILGLCAVLGLKKELGLPIRYKCSPTSAAFVQLFAGVDQVEVHDSDTRIGGYKDIPPGTPGDHRQVNQGYNSELVNRGVVPRIERYCRNIGAREPVLPELLERDRLQELGGSYRGVIALAPGTAWDTRAWPYHHWLSLERALVAAGHRVVICDTDAGRCEDYKSEKLINEPAHVVVSVLLNAACCVSNDSGLAHVAGVLGRPTVCLSSVTTPSAIYGVYPRVLWPRGVLGCSGCWWQSPHSERHCSPRCPDLATVTPERVVAAIAAATRLAGLDCPVPMGVGGVRADRRDTMTGFVRHVLTRTNPLIVETGCQRSSPDPGTGESTTLLGLVAIAGCGRVLSVDNDSGRVNFARDLVGQLPVDVRLADSVEWLLGYQGRPVDGLYLDSADTWVEGFERVCLDEAQAGAEHVAGDGRILIDDTVRVGDQWQGKGAQAVPWLLANGWRVVASGYQVLLERVP